MANNWWFWLWHGPEADKHARYIAEAALLDTRGELEQTRDELSQIRETTKAALKLAADYYEADFRRGRKLGCSCAVCASAAPLLKLNNTTVGDVVARLGKEKADEGRADADEAAGDGGLLGGKDESTGADGADGVPSLPEGESVHGGNSVGMGGDK